MKNSIKTVDAILEKEGRALRHTKSVENQPLPSGYWPELEQSDELVPDLASRYLQLIGILLWAVELGRIDIYAEVAVMYQYLASPRLGYIKGLYHVFAYLKKHKMLRTVLDPKRLDIDELSFTSGLTDWKDFYGDIEEELPTNMPDELGKSMHITCFVDAKHAGKFVTRRSHTGVLIYVQNNPIIWFLKNQNTVESSNFGSEFIAIRIVRDLIFELGYKLRMFGVPLDVPADVMCDN